MFSANASQVSNDVKYIEDFCSVYLRTGTGASQTVTTGVKENTGALVISKSRSAATDWAWYDTFRGATYDLVSNSTAAQTTQSQGLTAFNADGHTWGTLAKINTSGATYVDIVLKPTPKFFDVVTYTGTGSTSTEIAHNLGAAPGMVICKKINSTSDWAVWHRGSGGNTDVTGFELNSTVAPQNNPAGYSTLFTSTTFRPQFVGSSNDNANNVGATYVAYLFAHNAGGFGLTGTDNVISCGSFTTDATTGAATVNLGWEPQWILTKMSNGLSNWALFDNMRGMSLKNSQNLSANASSGESSPGSADIFPSATGFSVDYLSGSGQFGKNKNIIYIAIRRGPMKVPTSGTSVFSPTLATFSGSTVTNTGFVTDMVINKTGVATTDNNFVLDRLRGSNNGAGQITLPSTSSTSAEVASSGRVAFTGSVTIQNGFLEQDTTANNIVWAFRRAPSFFDEVCYTGTGAAQTLTHNLQATPELVIIKSRSGLFNWAVLYPPAGYTAGNVNVYLNLNTNSANLGPSTLNGGAAYTSTTFSVSNHNLVGASGGTYVAYLFATCAGVSKVGSYTGNGSSQTINCGFTSGARFVLIKSTSAAGHWRVYDTARGIVAGNEPELFLNLTNAEQTVYDAIDTDSSGFIVNSNGANVNDSGVTYIFLAIA
jgi:hypothetical protein